MADTDTTMPTVYLKLTGIDGESQDQSHKGEIELISVTMESRNTGTRANSGTGTGAGSGKVNVTDIACHGFVSSATNALLQRSFDALTVKTGKISWCKGTGDNKHDYMTVDLTKVIISSCRVSNQPGHELAHNSFELNFDTIVFNYLEQDRTGTLGPAKKAGWDLANNVSLA